MKKSAIMITVVAVLLAAATAYGRQPARGYRGFIDWGVDLGTQKTYWGKNNTTFYTGPSTTHGYQFNPHLFVGAGVSVELCTKYERAPVAFYAAARTDWKFGRLTPWADLRLGYCTDDSGGLYFSPTVGHRFSWGRKAGFNLGLGLTLRTFDRDLFQFVHAPDGSIHLYPTGTGKKAECTFALRAGFDF